METQFNIGEMVYVVDKIHDENKYELYQFKITEIKLFKNKVLYGDGRYFFPEEIVARTIPKAKDNIMVSLWQEYLGTYELIHSLK